MNRKVLLKPMKTIDGFLVTQRYCPHLKRKVDVVYGSWICLEPKATFCQGCKYNRIAPEKTETLEESIEWINNSLGSK